MFNAKKKEKKNFSILFVCWRDCTVTDSLFIRSHSRYLRSAVFLAETRDSRTATRSGSGFVRRNQADSWPVLLATGSSSDSDSCCRDS